MGQQPALALDAAAIAGERAIGADDAMAGDDDADGIVAIGMADGTHGGPVLTTPGAGQSPGAIGSVDWKTMFDGILHEVVT